MTPQAAPLMLPAMPRRLVLSLLGLALPICTAQAAGLPCQPCAGLRLATPLLLRTSAAPAASAVIEAGAPGSPAAGAPPATPAAPGQPRWLGLLRAERLAPGSPLFIAWEVPLPAVAAPAAAGAGPSAKPPAPQGQGPAPSAPLPPSAPPAPTAPPASAELDDLAAAGAAARAVAAAGGTPWLSLVFRTPAPLTRNLAQLQAELTAAAEVATASPRGTWFQIVWRPAPAAGTGTAGGAGAAASGGQPFAAADYAFLLKRAAVAVGGAQSNVHVATAPLPADPAAIAAFYGAEVAAYVDLVALDAAPADGSRLADAAQKVHELDPGRPIALDALPYPTEPAGAALAEAARQAAAGFDLTLFRAPGAASTPGAPGNASPGQPGAAGPAALAAAGTPEGTAAVLNPLALLAREFAGDLSYDPGSAPTGAAAAWAFVRGKDLALRVIAVLPSAPPAAGAAGATVPGGAPAPSPAAETPPPPGSTPPPPPGRGDPRPARRAAAFPGPRPAASDPLPVRRGHRGAPQRQDRAPTPSRARRAGPRPESGDRARHREAHRRRAPGRRREAHRGLGARDAGRGDPQAAAGVRGSPAPPPGRLHRGQHHPPALPTRLRRRKHGADPGRSVLLEPRCRRRLGLGVALPQRRPLARQDAARDPAHPAGEGGGAPARDPVHPRVSLSPARHREARRPRRLGGRLRSRRAGRRRPPPLPGHGVDRPDGICPPAHPRGPARSAGRGDLERRNARVLADRSSGPACPMVGGQLRPAAPPGGAGDPVGARRAAPGRARDPDHPRPGQPARLRRPREERPGHRRHHGARHRPGVALPGQKRQRPARRQAGLRAEQAVRAGGPVRGRCSQLSAAARRRQLLHLRFQELRQAGQRLLRRRAAGRQRRRAALGRHPVRRRRRPLRHRRAIHRQPVPAGQGGGRPGGEDPPRHLQPQVRPSPRGVRQAGHRVRPARLGLQPHQQHLKAVRPAQQQPAAVDRGQSQLLARRLQAGGPLQLRHALELAPLGAAGQSRFQPRQPRFHALRPVRDQELVPALLPEARRRGRLLRW